MFQRGARLSSGRFGDRGGARRAGWAAGLLCLAVLVANAATAHVASREQWHPLAAAYLDAVFASRIAPVDWTGIAHRYGSVDPVFRHVGADSPLAALSRLSPFAGDDPAAAIRRAIEARDAARLRAAAARANAIALRSRLEKVRDLLDRPRAALAELGIARGVYRGFEPGLLATDPKAYRGLGLAWLSLTTVLSGAGDGDEAERLIGMLGEAIRARFETGAPPLPPTGRLPPGGALREQEPLPRLVLNFEQRGVDEKELFLVAFGDMLFDSPEIVGPRARALGFACSACHNRGDVNRALFVPGLSRRAGGIDVDNGFFNPRGNDGRLDPLDVPSLRGIRFTAPYGRDGRMASLREFTRNVIVREFGGPEPSPLILDALVAYMNEFDFLPAPLLERDGTLNDRAGAAAKRGEAIFNRPFAGMEGRSCAACHIPDGNFVDGRRHDIGSVASSSPHARDGALDTPTLLGVAHSAPYFHDGSLPTLAAVVDWFDRRYRLGLDESERSDLTAYLEAVGTGEEPFEAFDGKNTRFRLGFDEASTFLSTLETLIPARDRRHALLLLRTVGRDLRADAAGMTNTGALAKVVDLAGKIDSISKAISTEDWETAERLWARYKEAEARHAAEIY